MKKYLKIASVLVAAAAFQALLGYEATFASLAIFAGTVSLKDLKSKADEAKKALQKARKEKKDASEVDGLKSEFNRLQEYIDAAEVEDKKETDQIEVKAPDPEEMTREEVSTTVREAVAAELKALLPADRKGWVDGDGLRKIVAEELAKIGGDSKTIDKAGLKTLVDATTKAAAQAAMDGYRREKKFEKEGSDSDRSGSRIEMPESWTKGNLPLHGRQMLNVMMQKSLNQGIPEDMIKRGEALGEKILSQYCAHARLLERHRNEPGMKALTSTGSTAGDELVPTDLSSQLQRRMFLASNLVAVMAAREIQMPTNPYTLPLSTTRPQFYGESTENSAATASTPATGQPSLSAVRMVGEVDYSYELDEDSIIPILPWLQTLLAEAAADAWEDALINGDTTGTHQDTDTAGGSAKLPAKFVKGFRKLALAITELKTDLSSGGIGTNANLLAVRKLLKKYGGDPRNLIWLASPTSAITLQGISEVATLEKFGNRATIITGEIAALQGIPIIQSERVREDVDATGVNGSSGNTKATVQCININRFLTGRKRDFMLESFRNVQSGTYNLVASFRKAFTPIEVPSSTITSVAIGYNFAP